MSDELDFQDQHGVVPAPPAQSAPDEVERPHDRLAAIDQAATNYVRAQRPANTSRAYAADWDAWCCYCASIGFSSRDISPGLLTGFVRWLETGQHRTDSQPAAPSTIRRRLYGTVTALTEHNVELPKNITAQANEAIKAYERRLARDGHRRGRGQTPAATVKQLRAICTELPSTLVGSRDRAVLLLGFAVAARRDELAHLAAGDITDDENGLLVQIRYSKTAERTIAVPYGSRAITCPVRAWHSWRKTAGITDGRAFRSVDRHGNLGHSITAAGIGNAISRAADHAGLMVHFTGHSLRSGLATEARRAGHDPHAIAKQGGWAGNSAVLHGYMRIVDQWDDSALKNIGL